MSDLTTELNALIAAYAKGIVEVEFNGIRKRYDNEAGLVRRMNELRRLIAQQRNSGRRLRVGLVVFGKR